MAYEGDARYWTIGLDYLTNANLLMGMNVNYEQSQIGFNQAINGSVEKSGFRGDIYAGYQFGNGITVEALASAANLDNKISANFDTGRTKSKRRMANLKVLGQTQILRMDIEPYLNTAFIFEDYEAYMTDGGLEVEAFSTSQNFGALGFETHPSIYEYLGLSPYFGLQAEWQSYDEDEIIMASGATFENDSFGMSYNLGVRGILTGVHDLGFMGEVLEGAVVDLDYRSTSIARDNASYQLQWSFSIPF